MNSMYLFAGIWVILLPRLFESSYFGNKKQYRVTMTLIGFFALVIGLCRVLDRMPANHILVYVLYVLLFVWNFLLLAEKKRKEKGLVTGIMIATSLILIIGSVVFVLSEEDVPYAIALLVASMIELSVKYEHKSEVC